MTLRNTLEMLMLAALWGASFLFMRIATPEFGAIALIAVRVFLAGLVLLPFWWFSHASSERVKVREYWWPLAVVGLLNSALPFVLFAYSTLHITGGFASILNATAPIWGAAVAWLWWRKPITRSALSGLCLGFAGVVILVFGTLRLDTSGPSLAIAAALFASIMYGIAANYAAHRLSKVSPLTIATFSQITAAVVLLPLSVLFIPTQAISVVAWASVISLAVFCTSLAYLLYFRLIASVGSTKAITVTFLIPVFGMFWGAVFIGEVVTLRMVMGSLVILFGTALAVGLIRWPSGRKTENKV